MGVSQIRADHSPDASCTGMRHPSTAWHMSLGHKLEVQFQKHTGGKRPGCCGEEDRLDCGRKGEDARSQFPHVFQGVNTVMK